MKNKKTLIITSMLAVFIAVFAISYFSFFYNPYKFTEDRPIKILHIMSYHSPWEWTDEQLRGFKKAFEGSGSELEVKVYQMDTKRQSSEEHIERVSQEAKELIEEYQPDLVYTNDDNAQKYVAVDYINSKIPFVFSAVNSAPSVYGYDKAKNVAGVREGIHFDLTVDYLKELYPNAKKISLITDDDSMWLPVIEQIKEQKKNIPDIELEIKTIKTFDEYKNYVLSVQNSADALMFLGIFNFKDDEGENVDYLEVIKWTIENSDLPDCSFWADRVDQGNLCAVSVSAYEQGLAAGKLARGILLNGKRPSSFDFEYTEKGDESINLARAETLGLKKEDIPSIVLINSKTINEFSWKNESN